MIRIAVCDDEACVTSRIETIIEDYASRLGVHVDIDIFSDGEELVQQMEPK